MTETASQRASHTNNAATLRDSGTHKVLFLDRNGGCLAFLLVWEQLVYDDSTDTYICHTDRDGHELLTLYTEGHIVPDPDRPLYAVCAPQDTAESVEWCPT